MEGQVIRLVAKLPVVCFNGGDELTIEGYMAKAALSDGKVELTSMDKTKLEYSLRVFKGLAANAAKQFATSGIASMKKKSKAKEKTHDRNRKSRTGLSGRRLRRRFSGGASRVPRAATGRCTTG